MPIDASVYENVKLPTPPDPLHTIGEITNLRGQQLSQQTQAVNLQSAQQKLAEQQAERDALQQTNGDALKASDILITKGFGDAGLQLRDTGLKQHQAKIEAGSGLLIGLDQSKDPAGDYQKILPQLRGLAPDVADYLGPTYDPQKVSTVLNQSKDAIAQLNAHRQMITGMYGTNPVRGAAQQLANAGKDNWDYVYGNLPPELQRSFDPHWSPQSEQRAKSLSMTGNQEAMDAIRSQHWDEMSRHNQFMEMLAAYRVQHPPSSTDAVKERMANEWYGNQMSKLAQDERGTYTTAALTPAQVQDEINRINNQYYLMLGVTPGMVNLPAPPQQSPPQAAPVTPTPQRGVIDELRDWWNGTPTPNAQAAAPPSTTPPSAAPKSGPPPGGNGKKYVVGQVVPYKGKYYKVDGIDANGAPQVDLSKPVPPPGTP